MCETAKMCETAAKTHLHKKKGDKVQNYWFHWHLEKLNLAELQLLLSSKK